MAGRQSVARAVGLRWRQNVASINKEDSCACDHNPGIDGKRISSYCGSAGGEAILGANRFKDLFAGMRDLVVRRSALRCQACTS